MNIPVRNPLLYSLLHFWLGMVTAVSFIETPLKFQVRGGDYAGICSEAAQCFYLFGSA